MKQTTKRTPAVLAIIARDIYTAAHDNAIDTVKENTTKQQRAALPKHGGSDPKFADMYCLDLHPEFAGWLRASVQMVLDDCGGRAHRDYGLDRPLTSNQSEQVARLIAANHGVDVTTAKPKKIAKRTTRVVCEQMAGDGVETVTQMVQLADEVIGLQIVQLASEIIDAANENAAAMGASSIHLLSGASGPDWNRSDLSIALRLGTVSAWWVVKLGGASFEAPSVIEALRGLLAIVKRFRATTERAV